MTYAIGNKPPATAHLTCADTLNFGQRQEPWVRIS